MVKILIFCNLNKKLELTIDHLPLLEEMLVCAFTMADTLADKLVDKLIFEIATRKGNGVNCPTPPTYLIPQIAPGQRNFFDL